ncbi:MAG: glycoside hydrolase family 3 N-terminal domain-containing protein [Bacteroidota bacterium]
MHKYWSGNRLQKKLIPAFILLFVGLLSTATTRTDGELPLLPSVYEQKATHWIDSVFSELSEEEKIGQLFMVAAYSNKKEDDHYRQIDSLIVNQHIGGLIFFQGGPVKQAQLTNHYQSLSKVPLLIGMDAEWGLGMRLDSTISYPKQMTLGAIQDNQYVYQMGAEIAHQCRRLGVHLNFAPVVDVNSNPNNPVIGTRSFGEIKENVAAKGIAYMQGLQHNGVMANAKHFPGHGDSGSDSHLTLPVISHPEERMNSLELYPFRQLIADSLMSMLVAHVYMPAFEKRKNMASTLSANVVTKLLKEDMGFKGLVFTDALNMRGVSKFYKPGEVDVLALVAGNDVLILSEDVPEAIRWIKRAVKQRQLSQADIDEKVKKVLRGKFWAKLNEYKPIELTNLYQDLNSPKAQQVKYKMYEQAATLVRSRSNLLPFTVIDTTTFASVAIGLDSANVFQASLAEYALFQSFAIPSKKADEASYDEIFDQVKTAGVVVVSLHKMTDANGKHYGIPQRALDFIEKLQQQTKVVVSVFGNAYSLKYFDQSDNLLCAYEDNACTQQILPQILFGALPANGKLPVSVDASTRVGSGIPMHPLGRLQYGLPESVGMSSEFLEGIDNVVAQAIDSKAMPGCQVLVARKGRVVFEKSYGYQTYNTQQPITNQTLYDIASVTKVAGTLQAAMFLYERGLLDINQKASYYLPDLVGTNKENIIIRDMMMHQAGLSPHIPFWERTRTKGVGLNEQYYRHAPDSVYSREVAKGLYTSVATQDSVWKWILASHLVAKPKKATRYSYLYSDLGYYMLQRIAEKALNQPLDQFLAQNIYDPLGLTTLTYNPLRKFPAERIAPTEDDHLFRHELIQGTVHDEGAAMLGGVAGHAGLFGTAHDLAILMQMNMQKGYYGGKHYLLDKTVPTFVKSYDSENRRGLGWDRPIPTGGGYISDFASRNSFGHSGFTGTLVWADPDEELVYIFLSNRVYPDANNQRLAKQAVRKKVQDIIYKSIINYDVLSARK